ncbi:MAG: 16S rRNA (guanine(966)-N(2))-methyltransferase RsmD [Clostridia bacterium]|nr:16S rRNA (guanine(966)-N(2))-methyltransferase RsmD [Clostridia bacterium]
MRVCGGKYRGLKLTDFAGQDIRPTSDRAKVSLFNILGDRVGGALVLDLFCGSGALGIECLSRGCRKACFNDISKGSIEVLKKNLARLKGAHETEVTREDFSVYLNLAREKFDIIFLDPPYREDYGAVALKIIAERGLLTEGGMAVLERDTPFMEDIEGLEKTDARKYGKACLTFFEYSHE